MSTEILKEITELINNRGSQRIVITSHKNPDGDAIGSSLALSGFLKTLGHKVDIIVPNQYPGFLAWIPNADLIHIYQNTANNCNQLLNQADIIFCLDYNALHRTSTMSDQLMKAQGTKVLIDHHLAPTQEFEILYSLTNVSSTAELIYNFIEFYDISKITEEIAIPIFVGILTDTGSFSFSCDNPRTFLIVSKLIEFGINVKEINQKVYDNNTENKTRLLGFCLSERLRVLTEFKTAYIYLSKEDLSKYNHQIGDTEGIVNYALAIQGVQLAALFSEKEGMIRISFRSKGKFDVNQLARNYFHGGGHKNAAGGNSKKTLYDTLNDFETIIRELKPE